MSLYTYKELNKDTFPDLKEVFLTALGAEKSYEEINKKYDTECFSLNTIGMLAIGEKGDPAAYYGAFPINLTMNGTSYLVAQSGDTMTAPNHRKKGLFIQLAEKTYQLAKEKKIEFVFGFPNENSYPGFQNKLKWVFFGCMQKFTIENATLPFCELAYKKNFLAPAYHAYVNLRLSNYKIELNQTSIKGFEEGIQTGHISKDLSFFQYKMRNENIHLIKINTFSFLIKTKGHLMIGAVSFFEKKQTNEFLKIIRDLGKKLGCRKTILTLSKNHWLFEYLQNSLPCEESLPIGFYQINPSLKLDQISFCYADYDEF
jgi:hypothetical protein